MPRREQPAADPLATRVRTAGLRCTAARLAVLSHLDAAPGPRTHAEVFAALSDRGFDRATIYRNLTELTEAGLVSRVELGDHVWRFEAVRQQASGTAAHPHFVCTTCGEVACLDDVQVAITPKPARRGKGRADRRGIRMVTDVLLKGRCGDCG